MADTTTAPEAASASAPPASEPMPRIKKVGPLPPSRATGERAVRIVASGYGDAGASTRRRALKGFQAHSGSADRDINDNNETLRQRSRQLLMGSPVAASAIKTLRTNVVGVGLVPKPAIDADLLGMTPEQAIEWQRAAEREFALWAEDKRKCDATGVNNFAGIQQLVLLSWLTSGDVFVLIRHVKRNPVLSPYGLRLHVIEADRVASPGQSLPAYPAYTTVTLESGNLCHDGVEVDKSGAIIAYHIRNNYPDDWTGKMTEWVRVPAYGRRTGLPNILHVMDAERPEQYRGVSMLAPVIEPLRQIERYTEAELMAAVVQSLFTVFITLEHPEDYPFNPTNPEGDQSVRTDPNEVEMGPGQINLLKPGESITPADPSRPNSEFADFTQKIAEQIGAALEIPVDLLLKSFNASYSASRAALMEAWKSFRMRRAWLVDDLCAPVWELFITEAVALGRLQAPGFFADPLVHRAYLGCEWIGPSQGQLDPTKEISAEILAMQNGLTTHQAAAARWNGSSFRNNAEQLRYENELLAEAAATAGMLDEAVRALPDAKATESLEGEDDAT